MVAEISPPAAVRRIARKLEEAGFETWCVGGAVRDALLGHPHLDWDLATAATPAEVRALFPRGRTIPVGIAFGTVGVLDEHGVMHEVTTFRRDVRTDGRHAEVEFGASLDEDLARRDFTINAIAFSPGSGETRDPFGGRDDLEAGIVRAVGVPADRMREDRLRALRGIRFSARFGFSIEPATWEAIASSAPHMNRLSAERVKQEIEKTMDQVDAPSAAFAMWRRAGALQSLVPPLEAANDVHMAAIDRIGRPGPPGKAQRRMLRLVVLFAGAPPDEIAELLRGLRFSNAEVSWISTIVRTFSSMEPAMRSALAAADPPGDPLLRRWAATAGRTRLASVIRLADARWWAERQAGLEAPEQQRVSSTYRRALRIAYRDPIELADLAVDGRDLERLGISGPAVGVTLRRLLESVINDPSMNRHDTLLRLAREGLGLAGPGEP